MHLETAADLDGLENYCICIGRVREWQGVECVVNVTADGFEWQGRPYKSLSTIARSVTGIHGINRAVQSR